MSEPEAVKKKILDNLLLASGALTEAARLMELEERQLTPKSQADDGHRSRDCEPEE